MLPPDIHIAYTPHDVAACIQSYPHRTTTVFVDIDDTIITPKSHTFRAPPFNQMIDRIKQHKDQYTNYHAIISHWRMQRMPMLVDESWPHILEHLKPYYAVYALTHMDTGAFGSIPSMEAWRYNELKNLGITFSDSGPPQTQQDASCQHGIIMTGRHSKAEALALFQNDLLKATQTLVMIDDRLAHLQDIGTFCAQHDLQPVLIHYKGMERLTGTPNPAVAAWQEHHLIQHATWIEDEDAVRLMNADGLRRSKKNYI